MKLPLLLCALVLSVHGWCAAVIPSRSTTRTSTLNHRTIENGGDMSNALLSDKTKTALIGWAFISYFAALTWWGVTAKRSLDKTLKEVLQDMARYS